MKFSSLYSGSSGNSIFVASDRTRLLVDAGYPGKHIENALVEIGEKAGEINGILVTHEHGDHIKGIGVLSRKYDIPLYATEDTWVAMEKSIGKIKENNIKLVEEKFTIGDLDINSFKIPHDASGPVGYTIFDKDKSCSIATDFGHITYDIIQNIKDSEIILIESNHDVEMVKFGPYPYDLKRRILSSVGHLSNEDCARAVIDIYDGNYKNIILGHLSSNNNVPELAYETSKTMLEEAGLKIESDIGLSVARRDGPSNIIHI